MKPETFPPAPGIPMELLTELSGCVLFTILDPHDGWKLKLLRELVAAGLNPSTDALH